MYLPSQFATQDQRLAARVMREHPLASLITTDDAGLPYVSHLPLHLQHEDTGFRLLGHMARPNVQWRHLQQRARALVTFMGPHAYMSPSVYPDRARVPSWNYVAVHCSVTARLLDHDDVHAKDALLKCLIGDHEPAYAAQWRDMEGELARKLLAGIVAFELQVDHWQCKIKLNQHRPESHAALHAAYLGGGAQQQALADWMVRLGLVGGSSAPSGGPDDPCGSNADS